MSRAVAQPQKIAGSTNMLARPHLLQRKCACGGTPGLPGECDGCRKKRLILQRSSDDQAERSTVPPIVQGVLRSPGQPLDAATRAFMEPRFGHDFSRVRVHTDARAAESARAVDALAYTVGRGVVFGAGQYAPGTISGRRLLAHELAHTLQQGQDDLSHNEALVTSEPGDVGECEATRVAGTVMGRDVATTARQITTGSAPPTVQRELLAYKTEHTDFLPSMAPEAPTVTYQVYTADAANIQSALQALISANKVGFREVGDRVFFFNRGATSADIAAAFTAAGYSKAQEMADALVDEHNISVYSREQVTKMSGLWTTTLGKASQVIERQTKRPLTGAERTEAQLVFGTNLDYDKIEVEEDPIMGAGSTARTTPWTINFPTGAFSGSNFMPWLIHELTHSWQYQHGYSLATTAHHALIGWLAPSHYKYGGEAALLAAKTAGKCFTSFNTEQQGSILADYYRRLKAGQDVSAWQPFVDEVKGTPCTPAPAPPATCTPKNLGMGAYLGADCIIRQGPGPKF